MSPTLVQPRWGQPFQKVGQFLRSLSRFGLKLFVNIVIIKIIKVFLPIHRKGFRGHPFQLVGQFPSYKKFFFVFSTLSVISAREGLIDLVAEYTPGAGAGIQSRSKTSLNHFMNLI